MVETADDDGSFNLPALGRQLFLKGCRLNSSEMLHANNLQVVAFDGHDLVVQITCQSGRDALGRPHIEVASRESASSAVDDTRARMAKDFSTKGWSIRNGKLTCPACAKKAALVGSGL